MINETKAYQYAKWCVRKNNKRVGKYVKLQCKKWIAICDGRDKEAYFDEKAFKKICKILKLMVHPDLHCPMYDGLEDYAWLLIAAVFCTKQKGTGHRYYQKALLEIARKNFKTFTSAVIFIIAMLTEPRFSRFFSVAPDFKLSSELQVAIDKIIKSSPCLDDKKIFHTLSREIRCPITDSKYTPLAYSLDRLDGKLANLFLADEAGAMDAYPIEAMTSSQITLLDKLGIIISTQYPNENNGLIDEIDIAKKTLDDLLPNKRYFALLYEPDEECQVGDRWMTDDNAIYQANPVAVRYKHVFDAIVQKRAVAILYENKRENFLCKHLNIRYKSLGVEGYIDVQLVKECRIVENLEFWKGKEVYLGLDLSLTEDNTSLAMVTYWEGKIYGKVWGFIPGDSVGAKSAREGVDYRKLIKAGVCFACGERVIDYSFVENFILTLEENYGVHIVQLGYDRFNAISTIQKLEAAENPIECVEIRQHSSVLHPATKLLKEYILQKLFQYDENLLLEINFQNAKCTEDTNLNKYVNKRRSSGKVDMVVSTINAVFLLNVNELIGMAEWSAQSI